MFSKNKRGPKNPNGAKINVHPVSYPYDERMDELSRINHLPDHDRRIAELKAFIKAEWEILLKIGEPSSQALTSAKASAKHS